MRSVRRVFDDVVAADMTDEPERLHGTWRSTIARCADFTRTLDRLDLGLRPGILAHALGMPAASALHKLLRSRRLPPFRLLRNWYYVVAMTERFSEQETVSQFALAKGKSPSEYYRLIVRVTGHSWGCVSAHGATWAKRHALSQWAIWVGDDEPTDPWCGRRLHNGPGECQGSCRMTCYAL